MAALITAAPFLLFLSGLVFGLFPQSGDDPLMMAPFAMLSGYLILSGRLLKVSGPDILLFLLLALWVMWTISAVMSPIPFPSKVTWVIVSTLPVSYMVARLCPVPPLYALPIICFPFALYTIWQGLHGVVRPDFPFQDSNLLGLLFAFGIISALPFTLASRKLIRLGFITLLCFLLAALIITQSRSAVMALLIGGGVYGFLIKDKLPNVKSMTIPAGLLTLFSLALVFVTGFSDRFMIFKDGVLDPNISGRFAIWRGTLAMATEHPLIGFGLGTFHLFYPPYRQEDDNSLGWMAHMDPLQTAVESGWMTTFILYALFIMVAYTTYKNRKTLTVFQASSVAILAGFFVAMHLDYPLRVVPFLMIAGACLAMMPSPKDARLLPPVTVGGIFLTLLIAMWISSRATLTFMLLSETERAYHLHDQPRFDRAIKACLTDGDADFPDCKIMGARALTLAYDSDHARIEHLLSAAIDANPVNPEIDYIRAQLALSADPLQLDEALALTKQSLGFNPAYWPARRMAIEILLKQGDKDAARTLLNEGLIYRYARHSLDDISRVRKELD